MPSKNFDLLLDQEFSHLKEKAFFNSAYFGPSPLRSKNKAAIEVELELDPSDRPYQSWINRAEISRNLFAELLGVNSKNIAHSTSTSDINSIVAHGLNWKNTDEIFIIDGEYPSNVLPWMQVAKQRELKLLKTKSPLRLDTDWLKANLTPNVKILALSHVAFDTGRMVDLVQIGQFLRERNIIFMVDTTQSFGGMPLTKQEIESVDIISCSSYKWLLGPYGHAFGYFSDRVIDNIDSKVASWINGPSSKEVNNLLDYALETYPGAVKFDRGQSPNMLINSFLEGSLEVLKELGLKNVATHNQELKKVFLENYSRKKYELITPLEHQSNIVSLKAKGIDSQRLAEELQANDISASVRQGNLRLSFHVFNTISQVEKLIAVLAQAQ